MKRLTSIQTIEDADGTNHKQIYCFGHLWGPAFFKKGTKDYEEYIAIVKRLAEYEDLEEQGKLLKLPCAVGDTLYCDGKYFASHCEGKIRSFKVTDIVTEIRSYFRGEVDYCFDFDDIGKTVFLTREEAEAALKALES